MNINYRNEFLRPRRNHSSPQPQTNKQTKRKEEKRLEKKLKVTGGGRIEHRTQKKYILNIKYPLNWALKKKEKTNASQVIYDAKM